MNDSIKESLQTLSELEKMYDSENIITIGQLCNRLSGYTVHIGKQTSDARKLWKELEFDYESSVRNKRLELIESGVGVAKAEAIAEDAFKDKEKDMIQAENGFDRLKRYLDRCDKVLESYKQYCSTIKSTNLKGI